MGGGWLFSVFLIIFHHGISLAFIALFESVAVLRIILKNIHYRTIFNHLTY